MSDEELGEQLVEKGLAGLRKLDHELVLLGHTQRAMLRDVRGVRVLNPGSVGQPRDGDPRLAYALIGESGIELRRIS